MTDPIPQIPDYLKGNEPELIGPEEASALLALNTDNRPLRQRAVDVYSESMIAEIWNPGGEIVLGLHPETGKEFVIDGQHRLAAIVQSGTIQIFTIIRNAPAKVQETMDTGIKRTLSDQLARRHEKQTTALAAATSILYRWDHGVRNGGLTEGTMLVPIPTLLDFFDQHAEDLRKSVSVSRKVMYRVKAGGAILSLASVLFSRIDETDADDPETGFFALLINGTNLPDDSPIYAFRETMRRYDKPGVRLQAHVQLALLIKAWNGFRDNRSMKILTYKPGGAKPEAFPEPR